VYSIPTFSPGPASTGDAAWHSGAPVSQQASRQDVYESFIAIHVTLSKVFES
jgi:hypothetical protein